jgi:hypothetical protein
MLNVVILTVVMLSAIKLNVKASNLKKLDLIILGGGSTIKLFKVVIYTLS